MIENPNVDQAERLLQRPRQHLVRMAGFRDARRMVVREYRRRCIALQRFLHDFPRVHRGLSHGAAEHLLVVDQTVLCIE